MDTHALSEPAFVSALEVLAANGVEVMIDRDRGYTPTPVISHAILRYNRGRTSGLADGIVITPSHNPPEDGGFKYNPPTGGPAGHRRHRLDRADARTRSSPTACAPSAACRTRAPAAPRPRICTTTSRPYVDDLGQRRRHGGASAARACGSAWIRSAAPACATGHPIVARYGIAATVVNDAVDPTFRFMTVDWDGKIRTDCSSPYAMVRARGDARSLRRRLRERRRPRSPRDRHADGGVDESQSLSGRRDLVPVHASTARGRPAAAVGKTVVSSSMIDRVTAGSGRRLFEVPVGFKWFVDGSPDRSLGFRRRGERRRVVPAARRHDVDHGQGRHHPRSARGGDHGDARPRSRSTLCRSHPRVRRAGVRADRRACDARPEAASSCSCRPPQSTRKNWRARPSARS